MSEQQSQTRTPVGRAIRARLRKEKALDEALEAGAQEMEPERAQRIVQEMSNIVGEYYEAVYALTPAEFKDYEIRIKKLGLTP